MLVSKVAKIGICWGIITVTGVGLFVLSKRSVDSQRYDSMKIRERMRKSNYGEYENSQRKFDI